MNKINWLLCFSLICSFNAAAEEITASNFNFKFLSSQSQKVKVVVIDECFPQVGASSSDSRKGLAIYRKRPIRRDGELFINFDGIQADSENNHHKITVYKINPLPEINLDREPLIDAVEKYSAILAKRYPYRFVTKKRSCMNQQNEFFQCLYSERETWNTLFFVNNGEISLNLLPVVDEDTHKVIGGAFMISYKIGTGKRLDGSA